MNNNNAINYNQFNNIQNVIKNQYNNINNPNNIQIIGNGININNNQINPNQFNNNKYNNIYQNNLNNQLKNNQFNNNINGINNQFNNKNLINNNNIVNNMNNMNNNNLINNMNNQFNIQNQLNGNNNNIMSPFNQINNNNFQNNLNPKYNNRGFHNNNLNINNQNLNNKEKFKCPKCKQLIDNKLKNDHLKKHQIDDAEKRKHRRQNMNDNDLRYNIHIRNQMMNNQRFRIPNNINNPHNHNNNHNINHININDDNDELHGLNGFLNFLRHGFGIVINNQIERDFNNANNNMQNGNYNNRNRNRSFFRPHIIGIRIIRNRNNSQGKHAINHFPEIVIEDVGKLDEVNKKCVICLEEFKNKEKVTALPCIHLFHTPCIKDWLKKQKICPICKFELTQENLIKKMKENSE